MRFSRILLVAASLLMLALSSGCRTVPAASLPPLSATNRWAKELLAFEAQDATNPPPRRPIVFTGSSSIRMWQDLSRDFPEMGVLNRGFGGSQLSDMQEHFERLILRYRPRQVVIYSGANDISAKKPVERVVADLKDVVNRIHRDLPKTRVTFLSIALNPSRWEQRERIVAANAAIAEFMARDPRRQYLDVTSPMLQADGSPKPDIFLKDRLHMNRKGYDLWIPVIRPALVR